MSHLLTPDMRKWHEELERFRADLAALRQRAEQAERARDALQQKVDEARNIAIGYHEGYVSSSRVQAFIRKWDAEREAALRAERTAAAPHDDAANEAEQEAQTHYP